MQGQGHRTAYTPGTNLRLVSQSLPHSLTCGQVGPHSMPHLLKLADTCSQLFSCLGPPNPAL